MVADFGGRGRSDVTGGGGRGLTRLVRVYTHDMVHMVDECKGVMGKHVIGLKES